MNSFLNLLGLAEYRAVLGALLLPPLPFLVLAALSSFLMSRRRSWGWALLMVSLLLSWLSLCAGTDRLLQPWLNPPPKPLSLERVAELAGQAKAGAKPGSQVAAKRMAIVILGSGRETYAPEYGTSNLRPASLERLHYGLWLARQTALPVAFSGGVGWAQDGGLAEATIAADIARRDYQLPLTWLETESRDTRDNANRSVALLKEQGVTHILLVTHGFHMRRALSLFEEAAQGSLRIEPAPMGLVRRVQEPRLDWLPTVEGYTRVRQTLHEWLGMKLM
jgi:uncharacterized SAM-binding protein YcdF (DUF218 family)